MMDTHLLTRPLQILFAPRPGSQGNISSLRLRLLLIQVWLFDGHPFAARLLRELLALRPGSQDNPSLLVASAPIDTSVPM